MLKHPSSSLLEQTRTSSPSLKKKVKRERERERERERALRVPNNIYT